MSHEPKKCAHQLCTCMVTEGNYCSRICEDSASTTTLACDCGHAGCKGEV